MESQVQNEYLKKQLADRDERIGRLSRGKKQAVAGRAAAIKYAEAAKSELAEARRTNAALVSEMLGMERRGRGRAKKDGPGEGKKGGAAGKKGGAAGKKGGAAGKKGGAAGKKGKGKKGGFTPLSRPHKGGPKPGEDGLPTVSEFLSDPDRTADESYEVDQKACSLTGALLSKRPVGSVGQTVIDMEVVTRKVRADKLRRWCPACGKIHTAQSPIALPNSRFSLRLDIFLAALKTSGMPYGRARALVSSILRIRIVENDLVRAVHRVARHLGPVYEEFKRQVRAAGVVNVDETSWWILGKLAWLWDFVTEWTVLFAVEPTRSGKVPRKYLNGFAGTVCKDSFGATNGIGEREQVCLQHYLREVHRTFEHKSPGPEFRKRMGPALIRLLGDAKRADRCKSKRARLAWKKRLEARVRRLARTDWTEPHCKRFAKRLRREGGKMFTFLEVDGVKWHNNDGERPFRPLVTIRKVSGGSRSEDGAQDLAVLHSVAQSCRARGWDFCGSMARYFAGAGGAGVTVRKVRAQGRGRRGQRRGAAPKGGSAMRLAWPVLDGPSIGDLAAPPPAQRKGGPPPKPPPPAPPRRRRQRGKAPR